MSACPGDSLCEQSGFLSSLLGIGCECHGYRLIIVGHSLGGAVGTLLGVRVSMHAIGIAILPSGPYMDFLIKFVFFALHKSSFSY